MSTAVTHPIASSEDAARKAKTETMLTPRFYTTDFKAMDALDVNPIRADWDAMMAEYEGDNNHDHFQRTPQFAQEVADVFSKVSPELRQEFLEFLISSCTSEFSGCILYNEIQKHVTNPDIKGLMRYMARDEARHAGFINSALKDFGIGLDLGDLKRTKKYTYFKPKYIFYATYLSEKIGYARYITMKAAMGLDPTSYDYTVFDITTEISKQVFPISLNTDLPAFRAGLDRLFQLQMRIDKAKARGGVFGKLAQAGLALQAAATFGRLYLLPVKRHDLPVQVRVAPAW